MVLSAEKQIYDTSQKPNKTSYETAIEALQDAANAQDTADGKRRVFIIQPYPPYDVGDLWTNGTDLYVCRTARQEGSFASGDWVLATAYVTKSVVESDMEEAVQKISGNLGGYIILHDSDDDGYPDELLIMNTDDITTATSVWRWNQAGLMWANSYTGQYATVAITNDGKIVADAITTGTLRGIEIISTDNTNTVDIVNGRVTTTGQNNAQTITTAYSYTVHSSAGGASLASMTLGLDSSYQPKYGLIRLRHMEDSREFYATPGYAYVSIPNGAQVSVTASATGGSIFMKDENNVTECSLATNSVNGGGELILYRPDGTKYLWLSRVFRGQWSDRSLTFFDTDGITTKSWYAGTRAFIKDTTSGEEGYVVHGHSATHGICVDYTASGRIDFYVDTNYVGYATLSSSDKRTKKSIKPISQKYKDAVASVDLKSFHFNFKGEVLSGANDLLRFGAIAQDVISALEAQGIDPAESELVDTVGEGKEERYVINYIPFLTARLAADEDRIQKLEEQNKALEERLARLEARLEE